MKIVGLTGGIACGKSSVSRLLSTEFKVPIVDADEIAHIVLSPGTRTYAKVLKAFGTVILQDRVPAESNASSSRKDEVAKQPRPIDRKKLGDIVFTDDAKRKQLGQLMNGAIAWAMFRAVLFHWVKGTRVVVLDVPLLYETGLDKVCDVVYVVAVSPEVQLARLAARDGAGQEDAKRRIAAQKLSAEDKALRANVILVNDGTPEDLAAEVRTAAPLLMTPKTWRQRYFNGPNVLLSVLLTVALVVAVPRIPQALHLLAPQQFNQSSSLKDL